MVGYPSLGKLLTGADGLQLGSERASGERGWGSKVGAVLPLSRALGRALT